MYGGDKMRNIKWILFLCISVSLSGCTFSGSAEARECFVESHMGGGIPDRPMEYDETAYQPQPEADEGEKTEPGDGEFVKVKEYIPDILIDLKYATADNFTGEIIYDFQDAYLRYGTVRRLKRVQEAVRQDGYLLKIWDAFRPVPAQFKLWKICPDPRYVADPNTGYSSHSKGNTVDITLTAKDGKEVVMPTGFDDFSAVADRDYSDCPEEAAQNARYLENIMISNGFVPYAGEWWHFADEDSYAVEEVFCPTG
jgi:D-alanyl-D-alanine dipeptidase